LRHPPVGYAIVYEFAAPGPYDSLIKSLMSTSRILSVLGFHVLAARLRPDYTFRRRSFIAEFLLGYAASWLVMPEIHEGIHAAALWLYTGERPELSMKFGADYWTAAAPDWYFPRGAYRVIGLGPLILLTVPPLLALPTVPRSLLSLLCFLAGRNVSASVLDMFIEWQLSRRPASYLNFTGKVVAIWQPHE
ncbi:MAG: DUF3267 domain-containing protein, partial [Chloroflexota bacterium]|nr:DUF3267 domain-containing protein [Chloroflexota bacterium]